MAVNWWTCPSNMTNQYIDQSERLLSRKQLARRWDKSIKTLKRWEKAGKLRPFTLGPRTVRYRLSDILAFEADAAARD